MSYSHALIWAKTIFKGQCLTSGFIALWKKFLNYVSLTFRRAEARSLYAKGGNFMNMRKRENIFTTVKEIEKELSYPDPIILSPALIPKKDYNRIKDRFQEIKRLERWYNYSGISEASKKEKHSPIVEILIILFGGIGGTILWEILEMEKVRKSFYKKFFSIKKLLPTYKKIAYEQEYFIKQTFNNPFPNFYGIVGRDEVRYRAGRGIVEEKKDKFGKADSIQMDELGKGLIAILAKRILFRKVKEMEISIDQQSSSYRFAKYNVYSSGGPIPNLFTEKILNQVKEIKFNFRDPLYPLITNNYPDGLYPAYDEDKKVYHTDYGVILWFKKQPENLNRSALLTFGCHGYGTVAAARAITDYESNKVDVEKDILREMIEAIDKGVEKFYVIVESEQGWKEGNWDIRKIRLQEGPVEIKQ